MKIVVCGGPRSGKTTWSLEHGRLHDLPVRHADDVRTLGWSEASDAVAGWMDLPGPWIIEGVATVRALRKWLKTHHRTEVPCDQIWFAKEPLVALNPGQESMRRGVMTVWHQIRKELEGRGISFHQLVVPRRDG